MMHTGNEKRDSEICRMFKEGAAVEKIAERFSLSRERVYRIVKRENLTRSLPKSDRDEFLGINVSESVKTALRDEAHRRGVSVSALSAETLREMLVSLGYPIEAAAMETP